MNPLREARLQKNLTQAQAAQYLGLSISAYRRIECRHRKRLPVSLLCRISNLYGKSLDELFR